jgi:hypothetical protein
MIGLSIFGIEIFDILFKIFAIIGFFCVGKLVLKKLNIKGVNEFLENLKQYKIYIIVIVSLLILFIIPLFLWKKGQFNNGSILYNSDVLGYYGAVVGGGITVLGIYWTFKYERMLSTEGRREESLPILNFSIDMIDMINKDPLTEKDILFDLFTYKMVKIDKKSFGFEEAQINLFNRLFSLMSEKKRIRKMLEENLIATKSKKNETGTSIVNDLQKIIDNINNFSSRAGNVFQKECYFYLTIENIGLQTAILSSITLCSEDCIKSGVKVLYDVDDTEEARKSLPQNEVAKLDMFAIPKGKKVKIKIAFYLFDCDSHIKNLDCLDYFNLKFTDVYHNCYTYKLPIKLRKPKENFSIDIDKRRIPVLPRKIDM